MQIKLRDSSYSKGTSKDSFVKMVSTLADQVDAKAQQMGVNVNWESAALDTEKNYVESGGFGRPNLTYAHIYTLEVAGT